MISNSSDIMIKHVLLIEIGTEELPAKMLRKSGESFYENIKNQFEKFNIIYEQILWFASSRRLAIQVFGIVIVKIISHDEEGSFLSNIHKDFVTLLKVIIVDSLMQLSVSVMMRWTDHDIKFIRPVRTVAVLLDDKVIELNLFGVSSDRVIRGHRFMAKKEIILNHAANYQKILLESGFVIVDYKSRKEIIYSNINSLVRNIGGTIDNNIDDLLEEVTALSEWPVILLGSFHEKFLHIPTEILLYIMKIKKKYFPVYDLNGKLLPYFIFVIDIIINDPEKIIFAHEKVLSCYFSDVEFFLNYDKQHRLEDYLVCLNTVSFYTKLGNLYDKSIRIKKLSIWIANEIGFDGRDQLERAAILSKCDLLSGMVSEFPFAQGTIGMYYARRDSELESVALAQKEQYYPRFFSDRLPSTLVSCIVSISDKIDTISGMFIIGKDPQGSGDPLGVRRAVFGVLRIILEKRLEINIWSLIKYSLQLYEELIKINNLGESLLFIDQLLNKINNFMYRRLYIFYKKNGYKTNIIRAILYEKLMYLVDSEKRVHDLSCFCDLKQEFRLLIITFKRIFNVLKKIPKKFRYELQDCLLIEDSEIILAKQLHVIRCELKIKCNARDYYEALMLLTKLYYPVDNFFNSITILCKHKDIRCNRLSLLYNISLLLLHIIPNPQYILDTKITTL